MPRPKKVVQLAIEADGHCLAFGSVGRTEPMKWHRTRALGFILLGSALLVCAACSKDRCSSEMLHRVDAAPAAGTCPDGWYRWDDPSAATANAGYGDGRCLQRCSKDSDCHDPERGSCTILGLFAGGDSSCNAGVLVCRCGDDECPSLRNNPSRLK